MKKEKRSTGWDAGDGGYANGTGVIQLQHSQYKHESKAVKEFNPFLFFFKEKGCVTISHINPAFIDAKYRNRIMNKF